MTETDAMIGDLELASRTLGVHDASERMTKSYGILILVLGRHESMALGGKESDCVLDENLMARTTCTTHHQCKQGNGPCPFKII
jgi:hypothetical protein